MSVILVMKKLVVIFGVLHVISSCNSKPDNTSPSEAESIAIGENVAEEAVCMQSQSNAVTRTPTTETESRPAQMSPQTKTLQQMIEGLPNNINLFGVWQMMPQAYVTLYQQNGSYYMQDIYMDTYTYGNKERMIKLSSSRFRFNDDTGEEFEIANGMMNGYSFGDLACQWRQVM